MIRIGTGGVPNSCEGGNLEGVKCIHDLGLDAMEIEFVYGVRMKDEMAREVGALARDLNVHLSIHAPYYINLNASDKAKLEASKKRILASVQKAVLLGADPVVFHPGFYSTSKNAYENVKAAILDILGKMEEKGWNVSLAPETTGKISQFGSVDELITLCSEIPGLRMTFDWAHVWARSQGTIRFDDVFSEMKDKLGKRFVKNLHMHFSGINYGKKGELNHLNLLDGAEPGFKLLVKAIKKNGIGGVMICESPNLEEDAIKMKKLLGL